MRKISTEIGNTEIIENPVEFQAAVSFLQLPETPLGLANGTAPSVLNQTKLKLTNTAPTTITNFLEGQEGQTIFVVGDGQSTVTHGTNIFTNSAASKLLLDGSVYILTLIDGEWREVAGVIATPSIAEGLTVVSTGPVHTFGAATAEENYPNYLHYVAYDTTGVTQYRRHLRYINATAGGLKSVRLWYSLNASTWTALGATLSSTGTTASNLSAYATLPAGAINSTVYFRVTVETNNLAGDVITVSDATLNFKV